METTTFSRVLEDWETSASDYVKRGNFHPESQKAKTIWKLSREEFKRLTEVCDPEKDELISVGHDHATVNHGRVGTKGIRYEF